MKIAHSFSQYALQERQARRFRTALGEGTNNARDLQTTYKVANKIWLYFQG